MQVIQAPASPTTVKAKTKGHTQNNTAQMLLSMEVNYGKGNTLVNCKHMSHCTANLSTVKDDAKEHAQQQSQRKHSKRMRTDH